LPLEITTHRLLNHVTRSSGLMTIILVELFGLEVSTVATKRA